MAKSRFTVTDLRQTVEDINNRLAEAGAETRFFEQGRNGYQAVDEYPVKDNGEIDHGAGCMNVGCGSSREVDGYCRDRYYVILNQLETLNQIH